MPAMHRRIALVLVAVALVAAWAAWPRAGFIGDRLAAGNRVVMYALTTCPWCLRMRLRLESAGVPFVEEFVDEDRATRQEPDGVRARYRVAGGTIGTPTLLVNDTLLLNDPPYARVVAALDWR